MNIILCIFFIICFCWICKLQIENNYLNEQIGSTIRFERQCIDLFKDIVSDLEKLKELLGDTNDKA